MVAPSHVKWEAIIIYSNNGLFFLWDTLWACKLLKLKEVVARVEGEPDPEGEVIVGQSGELLRLPVMTPSLYK